MGEIDEADDVSNLDMKNSNFSKWKNVVIQKNTDDSKMVALFYNNDDKLLSNKKIRQALNYSLPIMFTEGQRVYSYIPSTSIYYNDSLNSEIYDLDIAKTLLEGTNLSEKDLALTLTTIKEYEDVAKQIALSWKKLGFKTNIKIADEITSNFQIQLSSFKIPKDPDQYALWHSDQQNNISHYKNLRIDKLLEDGRKTSNIEDRIKIYRDFQKYISDDVPASMLFYPYSYTLTRKL